MIGCGNTNDNNVYTVYTNGNMIITRPKKQFLERFEKVKKS